MKDQLLVEVGDANQYAAAKLVGISNVAVNTETPEAARRHGFEIPEFDSFVALKKRNSPVFSGLVVPNHKIPIV